MATAPMSCELETAKKVCDFPSAQLLAYRGRLAEDADQTQDPEKVKQIMQSVLKIDQLRLLHEDIDGCPCWYEGAL